jgi:hypothetical protein
MRLMSEKFISFDETGNLSFEKKPFDGFPSKHLEPHWSHGLDDEQVCS